MNFCMVGLDYRRAPLGVRERVFLSPTRVMDLARDLVTRHEARGVFVLSTCARTEIYGQGISPDRLKAVFLALGLEEGSLLSVRHGQDAVGHLFAVTAGADSPVFGDPDVLRQVKTSYLLAREAGTLTKTLARIVERALCAGRNIRRVLQLTQRGGGVAACAVQVAVEKYGDLKDQNIYVIGCGIVGQALAMELSQHQAQVWIVANRQYDRAMLIAREHGCRVTHFDGFYEGLPLADMVFCATNSPHCVFKVELFKQSIPSDKSLVIFDLAVPRDVNEEIASIAGVRLHTIDDIGALGAEPLVFQAREMARRKAAEFLSRERLCAV